MPLFEVEFIWTLSGADRAVVEAKTPREAKEKFQEKYGSQFEPDKVLRTADFLALEAIDTEPFQYNTPENSNDDYEIVL